MALPPITPTAAAPVLPRTVGTLPLLLALQALMLCRGLGGAAAPPSTGRFLGGRPAGSGGGAPPSTSTGTSALMRENSFIGTALSWFL